MKRLLLLFLFAFAKYAAAQSCTSRVFCKTANVRFMSMHQATGVYLNATAVKSATTRNVTSCQTLCLRHNGCFSINLNISKVNEYGCYLLSTNIYNDSKNLVEHKEFIHLFMESPCKRRPCKNNGICSPKYIDDSYSCKCNNNATFIASGKDCEIIASGVKSADYYWTFEKISKYGTSYYLKALSGTNINVSNSKFLAESIISVPGRRGSVYYIKPGNKTIRILSNRNIQCLNTFSNCQSGVSYGVWIRMPEGESKREIAEHHIFYSYSADNVYWGIHFVCFGDETKGYEFKLIPSTSKKWILHGFGKNVKRTLWNHFMFTLASNGPLCAYINGLQVQCTTTSIPVSKQAESVSFRIGQKYKSSECSEMYVDEFAVWRSGLAADDVKDVYYQGKL